MINTQEVSDSILKNKIITIVRGVSNDKLCDMAEAFYRGGLRLLEITFDQKSPETNPITAEGISMLAKRFAGRMHIGAGTVCTPRQVLMARDSGAEFIVSPNTDEKIIALTKQSDMVSVPGAFTPSEMQNAYLYGADFIKIFPAGCVTHKYVKEILAPLSHLRLLMVGGVTAENLKETLATGVCGVGIQSGVVDRKAIEAGDFERLTELARAYAEQI